jgi:beta-phosphoglucomutase
MLFDLDGVLVHSMPLHTEAWRQYLDRLGMRVEDIEGTMHGKRNPELVREWFGNRLPEDAVVRHGREKERLFRELVRAADASELQIPGLFDFLQRHPDIPKAIGSNAERANIDFILDHFGLRPFFQVIVPGDDVQRPKPFPDIYLQASERLHVPPPRCIVFEDSPTGAEAGRAAGMRVVAVETTPTEFRGVDLVIRDFLDPRLEDWLAAAATIRTDV